MKSDVEAAFATLLERKAEGAKACADREASAKQRSESRVVRTMVETYRTDKSSLMEDGRWK